MIKKRILLVNPHENIAREQEIAPSGALLLLGTLLLNRGHKVKIIHLASDKISYNQLKIELKEFIPDFLGLSVNTFQVKSAKECARICKELSKNITIIAGGPHPSALKLEFLNQYPDFDIVVAGEGENSLIEIVEGSNLGQIPGICYKNKVNPPREYIANLDELPFPDKNLIGSLSKYSGIEPIAAKPQIYIMASRGCPYQCIFCNKSIWGSQTRFKSPQRVVEEVLWYKNNFGAKEVYFQDDTFNLNRGWATEIMERIISSGLNNDITFRTPFRANESLVDLNLLKLAKKANFWAIFYGVENGSQVILDKIKKGLKLEEIERAFKLTHEAGLKTIASFMIGNIGENWSTFHSSLNFKRRLNPSYCGFSLAIPFPGTEFHAQAKKSGHLLDENFESYTPSHCVIRTNQLTPLELKIMSFYGYGLSVLANKNINPNRAKRLAKQLFTGKLFK